MFHFQLKHFVTENMHTNQKHFESDILNYKQPKHRWILAISLNILIIFATIPTLVESKMTVNIQKSSKR